MQMQVGVISLFFITDVIFLFVLPERTKFSPEAINDLETWIDHFTEELPPLTNFILPVSIFLLL